MRNNLDYYTHDVNSHNHWKFKVLRKRYGWAGEGKFWALNNMIAASQNCVLDLSDEVKMMAIAAEIDFDIHEVGEYLKCLVKDCRLLVDVDQKYTTEIVTELFEKVDKTRERKREWKMHKMTGKNEKSTSTKVKSTSTLPKSTPTLNRVEKSRVEESKVNNIVSNDTIESESKSANNKPEKCNQKELANQYSDIEKSKANIFDFIKNKKPLFVDPYCDTWNMFAQEFGLPKITLPLTAKREKHLLVRLREHQFDFLSILHRAKKSEYLLTGNWFTFDWIIKNDSNFLKILEGNYDSKESIPVSLGVIGSTSIGDQIRKARVSAVN